MPYAPCSRHIPAWVQAPVVESLGKVASYRKQNITVICSVCCAQTTTTLFCAWKTNEQRRESRVSRWDWSSGNHFLGLNFPRGMASPWDQEGCGNLVPHSNQMCRWRHHTANSIMGQPRFWGCKTCIPTLPLPYQPVARTGIEVWTLTTDELSRNILHTGFLNLWLLAHGFYNPCNSLCI